MSDSSAPILEIRGLRHDYRQPDGSNQQALKLDSLEARRGERLVVSGPSGSGKTTLLHILAALIRPTHGEVIFSGQNLNGLGASRSTWRAASVGYIFQEMNLLPDFDILDNLLIAAEISNISHNAAIERAKSLISDLVLTDRMRSRPRKLSLGEQQRAAVARAVIHSPVLVLADEPTASLDADNTHIVMKLLLRLCEESQSLLIVATHEETLKKLASRTVLLEKAKSSSSYGELS
ncbi:MAG: ATP-binding cassette domain-containing protein [Synergistaceae bacterium]|jgi:ABC-type lipoprotein export system ATPase subunit|nr:ATP-binding cassette domain-containing protein [Synergistaceae bacterium]